MTPLYLSDASGLPQGMLNRGDIFPLASTDSTTESGDSFISQVPGEYSPSPYSRPVQLPCEAAGPQLAPMSYDNLPAGAQGMCAHPVRCFLN
jgi:hypothetical protein